MVLPGVICLNLSEVMRSAHCNESLNTNSNHQVDADAQRDSGQISINTDHNSIKQVWPVERIVNVWKYIEKMDRVEFSKTITHSIHAGEDQMQTKINNLESLRSLLCKVTYHKC